jgi:AcrR family transcriptional regulator
MAPRPDVSEERKNQILDAATEVFIQKGFDEARMDDIVDEAGLSKGALYWYFKSKDEIIISILDRIFQREFRQIDALKYAEGSASESILQFIEIGLHDLGSIFRLMPIIYEFLALAFRNKIVQAVIKRYLNRYLNILTTLIQRGIDSGEFRQVEAKEVAIAASAIFEGTLLLWIYDKSRINPEQHIRSGIKLLLDGIRT